MERSLTNILPIFGVEHDCILSKQGDITVVYEVHLPELFTLSNSEYEAVHQTFVKAIKVLPKYSVFHKQDWFTEAKYRADFSKENSFLGRSSERYFHERPYLEHQCFILLTKKLSNRRIATSLYSNLLKKSIVPGELLKPALVQDFLDHCGQFERILSDSGFMQLKRVTNLQLAGNKRHCGLIERYLNLNPSPSNFLIQELSFKEGIQVGGNYCQLYTLADAEDLPALCGSRINYDKFSTDKTKFSVGFVAPLGQLLSCNHIYNQYIFIDDGGKTLQKLESKRLRLQSLSAYSRENAIARDATNAFLNEAIAEQRLPVKAHFNVLVWTDDKARLKELKNKVCSALAQMDAVPKLEVTGAPQIFWAGMPGNEGGFPMNDTFDTFTEQACCFLNFETAYRSSTSPYGIRFGDRLSGKPVYVDLFDEPMKKGIINNRNLFVCGGSGGGKSMTMNHILRTLYDQGAHCVIVDIGGSYQGLCSLVNGYYFTYTTENPIQFNPFYIEKGDFLDTEKLENLKALLVSLYKEEGENFNRTEYVALSNALKGYYDHLKSNEGIFPCFDSFYEYIEQVYTKVFSTHKVKDKDFDIDNFLYVLKPYYKGGEFDYLLNATENLDLLGQRFIVFELDNIKDHPILFPVVTLVIMELFISKMRKLKGSRKVLVIEEAWKAIAKSGMAGFIKYVFKTVRKFGGIPIVVSQEIDDLLSSPIIKEAIINNADIKILTDMRKFMNRFDQLQSVLGLSEKGKTILLSVNLANDTTRKYREVFIDLGGQHMKVYRNELSIEEYMAYTTEETEKVKVMQYAKRYGTMEKGIATLAVEMKNSEANH